MNFQYYVIIEIQLGSDDHKLLWPYIFDEQQKLILFFQNK